MERYDLIVHDISAIWGIFLGKILNRPYVCCFPGLAPQWRGYVKSKTIIARGIMLRGRRVCEGEQPHPRTPPDAVPDHRAHRHQPLHGRAVTQPHLHLCLLSAICGRDAAEEFPLLRPVAGARRETVEFPLELLPPSRRKEAKSEGDVDTSEKSEEDEVPPLLAGGILAFALLLVIAYISMGTLYRMNPLFFRTCFAAFKNSLHLFVMSVGKGNLENVGETPDNFIVKEYVLQPQILDRASMFISHGGMGGISEAMVSNMRCPSPLP